MVGHTGLEPSADRRADELAEGDEERVDTDSTATDGSGSQLSEVQGSDNTGSTDTDAEYKTADDHLRHRKARSHEDCADNEAWR